MPRLRLSFSTDVTQMSSGKTALCGGTLIGRQLTDEHALIERRKTDKQKKVLGAGVGRRDRGGVEVFIAIAGHLKLSHRLLRVYNFYFFERGSVTLYWRYVFPFVHLNEIPLKPLPLRSSFMMNTTSCL